ncbi:hypothetical protein glysoja_047773 [Glycine soja]|uniref:Uncharacterized protein n=1 Tax=Glycine soja TaxID=3848 RepID=A0A0B2SQW8_GLYSO|nr:hypothetical protein glysoja_047773 [Glycine soja]
MCLSKSWGVVVDDAIKFVQCKGLSGRALASKPRAKREISALSAAGAFSQAQHKTGASPIPLTRAKRKVANSEPI